MWEGFVEKVGFEPGVKEWRSDGWREWARWEMGWQVDEEANQDKNGEADGTNLEVDSKHEVLI